MNLGAKVVEEDEKVENLKVVRNLRENLRKENLKKVKENPKAVRNLNEPVEENKYLYKWLDQHL
jgi:hypothetical protein